MNKNRIIRFGFLITFLIVSINASRIAESKDLPSLSPKIATFDMTSKVDDKTLIRNGVGIRKKTIFSIDVYAAALYLEHTTQDYKEAINSNQMKQIDVVFLRDVQKKDIVNSWNEGFEKNCQSNCKQLQASLDELNDQMVDVKARQKISIVFYPDRFTVSTLGRQPKAVFGKEFSKIILATFIGNDPPTVDLRDGMMGLKQEKEL